MKRAQVPPLKRRRIRRSCERCRHKKVKCPAEKPSCSFCRRLNQSCVYLPRNQTDGSLPASLDVHSTTISGDCGAPNTNLIPLEYDSWRPDDPEPSTEALEHLARVYRDRIYFQPAPLFDPHLLKDQLRVFPYYLRWSFLALTLHFSSHAFYSGSESEAIELYTTASRGVVQELCAEGVVRIEVLQSLCLLALCEILDGEYTRAWMTIGAAARLEALRLSQCRGTPIPPHGRDAISRCHWSIFVLEKTFTPNLVTPVQKLGRPKFPRSPEAPGPIEPYTVARSHCPDLSSNVQQDGNSPDLGINANCLELISIWGDIVAYLQDVRCGLADCPWSNTSRHARLGVAFYEFEVRVSSLHMLRRASFPDRPISEIYERREYWMPWLTMEILYHASKAALDNPFVQLFALRGSNAKTQPGSYLQKAVDQALFNYEWVARLIQMVQGASFEMYDPLLGSAVAATATVPWIFQFARDEQVAQKARQNLELFESFLETLSLQWPHIAGGLKILQELRSLSGQRDETGAQSTTIRFQPDLIWGLLCLSFPLTSQTESNAKVQHSHPPSPNATLHVTTQYMHPLIDPPVSRPLDDENMEMFLNRPFDGFDGPFLEGFFSQTVLEGVF